MYRLPLNVLLAVLFQRIYSCCVLLLCCCSRPATRQSELNKIIVQIDVKKKKKIPLHLNVLFFKKWYRMPVHALYSTVRGKLHLHQIGSIGLLLSSSEMNACVCVCVCAPKAASPRVGIRGQSSLYAVCRAPRQKRCRAVKHSVTKTTCFRVYNIQTQASLCSSTSGIGTLSSRAPF